MSESIVAALAVMALGASAASATVTPTTNTMTAKNTGTVTFGSGVNDTCTTVDLPGDINMDSASGAGGGGVVTGWTPSGCLISPTGAFTTPWTLNIFNLVSGNTWSGLLTGIDVTISLCHLTGSLPVNYDNSTGRLTLNGGTLNGGICGSGTITGSRDLRGGASPLVLSRARAGMSGAGLHTVAPGAGLLVVDATGSTVRERGCR